MELAKAQGAKRALPLPVSAPFHCALMQPAAEAMAEALAQTEIAAAPVRRWSPMSRAGAADRSRRDPRQPGAQVTGHGALARKHGLHGGRRA